MVENLNSTHFKNGDSIPEVKTDEDWINAWISKQPAWYYYKNDPVNGEKNGNLYNRYAIVDPRGLAPEGWHFASRKEIQDLIQSLRHASLHNAALYLCLGKGWVSSVYPHISSAFLPSLSNLWGLQPPPIVFKSHSEAQIFNLRPNSTLRHANWNWQKKWIQTVYSTCWWLAKNMDHTKLLKQKKHRFLDAFLSGGQDYLRWSSWGCNQ